MIKYNKQITLERKRNGDLMFDTDRGDVYQIFGYNRTKHPVGDWWKDQYQSEIRNWQKDLVVAYAGDALGALELFVINKRGKGYSQDHDMCLAYSERYQVWILSTQEDYWVIQSDSGQIVFDKKHSLGSVLNQQSRLEIGNLWDRLKTQINPENECLWVRY